MFSESNYLGQLSTGKHMYAILLVCGKTVIEIYNRLMH